MAYRLLLISAELEWGQIVATCAAEGSYGLEVVKNGALALKEIMERRPDLALLDLNIADIQGLAWLKMLRQTEAGTNLPVIVSSDRRPDDLVAEAFAWGADDFVLKTCHPAELLARMRAVLRRRFEREEQLGSALSLGSITLDPSRHQCLSNGKPAKLRPREFELLEILMRKAGRVLSRQYLLETIWGMSRFADTRTVDVAVSRLRKALGVRGGKWVETVERYGYRFRNPEETGR